MNTIPILIVLLDCWDLSIASITLCFIRVMKRLVLNLKSKSNNRTSSSNPPKGISTEQSTDLIVFGKIVVSISCIENSVFPTPDGPFWLLIRIYFLKH